jgi:hypothetical protein
MHLTISLDSDFDYLFYLEEYPDVKEYYKYNKSMSLEQKLFHHYINHGKSEGRLPKRPEDIPMLAEIKDQNKLDISELSFYANKLECIAILVTEQEAMSGLLNSLFIKIRNSTLFKETRDISLKIVINNIKHQDSKIDTAILSSLFTDIEVINLQLSAEEDLYIRDQKKIPEIVPTYGTKSGPNIMFYKALNICKTYNTTLLLETDCFFKPLWLSKLQDFINASNGFWISGATYDGVVPCRPDSEMSTHINGGIALYATGNESFQKFMSQSEDFLIERIKSGLIGLAYDINIKAYIDYLIKYRIDTIEDILASKFILRQYLPNKIIGNFSSPMDIGTSLEQIEMLYNYYIVHKKPIT